MTTPPAQRLRFDLIDILRGVALIAMVIYHFCWDLSFLRYIAVDVSADPAWVIFARTILASFLFLVGVGLVLGHGQTIRWPAFRKRFLILVAGAAVITVATLLIFPDSFVYFGILHAIALFSLLALPFLWAPLWLVAVLAVAIMALGWTYTDMAFNVRPLSWIGLWTVPPLTNDLVPVFPWFGVVLAAIALTRLALASQLATRIAAIMANTRPLRALAFLGRWTLLIYLVHQPILLGVLYPLSLVLQPAKATQNITFLNSCQSTCLAGGTSDKLCTTYCQCGLTGVIDNDLWAAVNSGLPTENEKMALDVITQACSALIFPVAPEPIQTPIP